MFDYPTLYMNIPHRKLKSVTREFINFCFNGGGKFIGVTRCGAIWTNSQQKKYSLSFNKKHL